MKTDITIGMAQIAPVYLDKKKTTQKMLAYVDEAATKDCDLVVFGEALLPGYPFWVELTGGAVFNSQVQKELYAYYAAQAIIVEAGELQQFCNAARDKKIMIILGFIERAMDRGGHSLYCALACIGKEGEIRYIHRKVMPTYEERLVWAAGDGHGLRVSPLEAFTVGALNCWENWMPLIRSSLYAQGEDLHVALWPGNLRNTSELTRFIALESRSFVISVSGLLHRQDISNTLPYADQIIPQDNEWFADGGSCIAAPDGSWVVAPVSKREELIVARLYHSKIMEERQNFDPSGHYSRPDIVQLSVDRQRQSLIKFVGEGL